VVCVGCGGDASRKYKCPKCRAAYCSAGCCRTHKEAGEGSECAALAAKLAALSGGAPQDGSGGSPGMHGADPVEGSGVKRARVEAAEWVQPLPHGMVPEEVPVVGRAALERVARSAEVRAALRDARVAEAVLQVDKGNRRVGRTESAKGRVLPGEALDTAIRGVPGFEALVDAILRAIEDEGGGELEPPAADIS